MLDWLVFAGHLHEVCPAAPFRRRSVPETAAFAFGLALLSASARADVPVVELVGVVHAISASHVVSAIERADAAGAPLVVLRLDTPGGLETSMREIIDELLRCKTPVVAFVGPSGAQSYSAGFLIAISADVVAMAPGTSTGAAHPVFAVGQMDEVMSKKVTSAMAAYIRSKAERRHRNVELAESAVVDSRSFTEKEALDGHLIDLVVKDVPDLLAALDGREVTRFDGTKVTLQKGGQAYVTQSLGGAFTVIVNGNMFRIDGKDAEFFLQGDTKDWTLIDATTASQWNFQGCATSGPAQGKCLARIPALKDYWFDWRNYNPKTTVYKK